MDTLRRLAEAVVENYYGSRPCRRNCCTVSVCAHCKCDLEGSTEDHDPTCIVLEARKTLEEANGTR